jgi:multicomponent K+:H+ antiporter subunit F
MIDTALTVGFGAVILALVLSLYRLVVGPSAPDRIVAGDTLYVNAIALLMLVGIRLSSDIFFEAALLIAMMGFVGTVAYAKHVSGRSVIE